MDSNWWHQAGGSGFVELVTGINIALCGWEHFQNAVRSWGRKVDEIIGKAVENAPEGEDEKARKAMAGLVNFNQNLWIWIKRAAFLCAVAGLVMLYLNRFCGWDFLLLLPLCAYWAISAVLIRIAQSKVSGIVEYGRLYRKELEQRTAPGAVRSRTSRPRRPRNGNGSPTGPVPPVDPPPPPAAPPD